MTSYEYITLQSRIPEPLCAFAGVYIPHNSTLLIHGGYGDSENRNIYSLNLESEDWRLFRTCDSSLVGHSAVEIEGRMLIFGGWNEKEYSDELILYDPQDDSIKSMTRTGSPSNWDYPAGRRDHSLTLAHNNVYLLGGWDSWAWDNSCDSFTKLWKLTQDFKWELCEVFGENPSTRRGHSTIFCKTTDELIVFGGIYGFTALLCDFYVLHLKDMQWNKLNVPGTPSKRAWHSAASVGDFMYLFGGLVEMKRTSSELFKFDMVNRVWNEVQVRNGIVGRFGGLMVEVEGFLIVLGGKTANEESLNDVHVLDIDSSYTKFRQNAEIFAISKSVSKEIVPPAVPSELVLSRKFEKKTLFDFLAFK